MAAAESKRDRSKSTTTLRTLRSCVLAVVVLVLFSRPAVADGPTITAVSTTLDAVANPFWSDPNLFFASYDTGKIYAYQPGGNQKSILNTTIENTPSVAFVVPLKGQPGHFAACAGSSMDTFIWNLTTADTVHEPVQILTSISLTNDSDVVVIGMTDCRGWLWVGTAMGLVFRVVADGTVALQLSGINVPMGIAWNTDGTKFYRSDYDDLKIMEHDFDVDLGNLSPNGTVVFDFTANELVSMPSGIAMDTEDNLWVACSSTCHIVKVDIKKGVVLNTVSLPEYALVTSVAFGSKKLDSLFVTTVTYNSSGKTAAIYQVDGTGSIGSSPVMFDLTPQLG